MVRETLVLVGRESAASVATKHAERLRGRDLVDSVTVATYGAEPAIDLADPLADIDADRTYVVPLCFAHTYETLKDVPRALSSLSGTVRYCDPVGESPAITDLLQERATAAADADSILLVGLGNSAGDHGRETAEFHAKRLREDWTEVRTTFLLQSPAVECARYALEADSAAVLPLFVADCDATAREIPEKLELDRGGLAYADPLGEATALTDAIEAEVERERILVESDATDSDSVETGTDLVGTARPVATDGRGADSFKPDE